MRIKLQKLPWHTWELEFSQLKGEEKLAEDYHGLGSFGSERHRVTTVVREEVEAVFGRFHLFMQSSGASSCVWEFLGEGDEALILDASLRIAARLGVELELA
jgi:hypothetical protein